MGKFDDDKREDLQAIFSEGNVPDEDDFAAFIQAIADGIEYHEHTAQGGPGSGTGDAALLTPDLGPGGTISDQVVDNLDTWRKLLPSHPYLATEGLLKLWMTPSPETICYALTCDAPHLYAGLYTSPAQVVDIDIADMTALQTWTGGGGENLCRALVFDGTFLYAGLDTDPARVVKISPKVMQQVSVWRGEGEQKYAACLTYDGTHLYVGLNTDPARVVKVYPGTMRTHGVWEGPPGWASCTALTYDGGRIYAGLDTNPAKVIKIAPGSMETVAIWIGDETQRNVSALAFDVSYIYAGLHHAGCPGPSAQVTKIEPGEMTKVGYWLGTSGQDDCRALVFDGEHIHAVLGTDPPKLIEIDPGSMDTVRTRIIGDTETISPDCYTITFDGLHFLLALTGVPPFVPPFVHISHYDHDNDRLKYTYHDADDWHTETAADCSPWTHGPGTSIAVDDSGYPHIAFACEEGESVKYAWKDASGWHVENIESRGAGHASIKLKDGYPHVSYYEYRYSSLRYAYKDAGGWHIETVDDVSLGHVGWFSSLEFDDDGNPHISYYGWVNIGPSNWDHQLRYAYKDAGGWHIEVVDTGLSSSYYRDDIYTSLALDEDGYPHIGYVGEETPYDGWLKYAYKDASGWHIEVVDGAEGRNTGRCASIDLDTGGYPHISYYDETNGDLKYTWKDAGGWHIETVDDYYAGRYTSLALDDAGYPHISYQIIHEGDGWLRYAYQDAEGWHKENAALDPLATIGAWTSIALSPSE